MGIHLFLLLALILPNSVVDGGGCAPGSSSCSSSDRKKCSCVHWCDNGDCPSGYPVGDEGNWEYCWGLKCDFWCYACNVGYHEVGNQCAPCVAGKTAGIGEGGSCSQCTPGKASGVGDPCERCPAGKYSDDYGKAICEPCITFGSGVHWYSTGTGNDHCDRCATGKIANDDSTGCESCSQGKYVNENSPSCLSCAPGKTTNDVVGYTDCTACPSGKHSEDQIYPHIDPMNSLQLCIDCEAGEYSGQGAAGCTPCQPGEYSAPGAPYCLACSAGKKGNSDSNTFTGSTGCVNCGAGKYSQAGAWECNSCLVAHPLGGYTSVPTETNGPTACIPCPAGTKSGPGDDGQCIPCTAGKFSQDGAAVCTECILSDLYGPGYYSGEGATTCSPCEPGTYLSENACVACPRNTYSNQQATSLCQPCSLGKYSNSSNAGCSPLDTNTCTGATVCVDCPENTKRGQNDTDSSEIDNMCVPCPDDDPSTPDDNEAKFAGTGSSICVDCPLGKYKPEGASECVACAVGKQQRNNGCVECDVGRYEPDEGSASCSYCESGQSTNNTIDGPTSPFGNTQCWPCQLGYYAMHGGESCLPCSAGKRAVDELSLLPAVIPNGGIACIDCLPGEKSDEGSNQCADCPTGQFSHPFNPSDFCTPCAPGKFTNETGKSSCESCYPGKYSADVGATSCEYCDPGKMTGQFSRGSLACQDCTSGKYSNDTDLDSYKGCDACNDPSTPSTVGKYAPLDGMTYCHWCPPGMVTGLWPQADECTACDAGKYKENIDDRSCDDCRPGKYSNASATECTYCPDNYYSSWIGRPSCDPCIAGKYANLDADFGADDAKMTFCKSCPAGKTSKTGSDCYNCPAGKYSLEGLSYCYSLPTGEDMRSCPENDLVQNVCKWYYVDGWTNSLGVPNEGDASPFGGSCANYTICSYDVTDNSVTDGVLNIDSYTVMCQDCATDLGFVGVGTIEGQIGDCAGKQFQQYCYEGNSLDLCPDGAACEYQYAGDEEDRGRGTIPIETNPEIVYNTRSPFTRTHDDDEDIPEGVMTSLCESYKVCGLTTSLGYPKLTIVCEECVEGFLGRSFLSGTVDNCLANPTQGAYPTLCYNLGTNFHTCPTEPLSMQRRELESVSDEQDLRFVKYVKGDLDHEEQTRRRLSCLICSCDSDCSFPTCNKCDSSDGCTCDHDDEDCDTSVCTREDEGGTTDDITSLLVDCQYLYGDRAELDNPATSATNVEWVEKDGGDRSPFYDKCELYVMCDLVTDSVGRDDYSIACGRCASGYFPALDTRFNQLTKPLCPGPEKFPTYCYPLDVNALPNLDYDSYCPDNNVYQINQCNIWHDGQWRVTERAYGGSTTLNPFAAAGCKRTAFCSFDSDDMTTDKYYLQCIECNDNFVPEYTDKVQLSDYDGYSYSYGEEEIDFDQTFNGDACADNVNVPPGKMINRCVQGPTSAPSHAPTGAPSRYVPATSRPSCEGCDLDEGMDNKAKKLSVDEVLNNPAILGGIGGGIFFIALVVFLIKKRKQREYYGESDSDSGDSEDDSESTRSSEGFEMTNPMKNKSKGKGGKGGRRRSSVKKSSKGRKPANVGGGGGDWVPKKDPTTGKTFYYNKRTKAVSWTPPQESDDSGSSSGSGSESGSGSGSDSYSDSDSDDDRGRRKNKRGGGGRGPPPGPPRGVWDVFSDPASGKEYYVHEKTGETTWDKPSSGIKKR